MWGARPDMINVPTEEAQERFGELVERAAHDKERVVLTRHGEALASVVPIEDLRLLAELEDRLDNQEADAALAEIEAEGTVPWGDLKKELDL